MGKYEVLCEIELQSERKEFAEREILSILGNANCNVEIFSVNELANDDIVSAAQKQVEKVFNRRLNQYPDSVDQIENGIRIEYSTTVEAKLLGSKLMNMTIYCEIINDKNQIQSKLGFIIPATTPYAFLTSLFSAKPTCDGRAEEFDYKNSFNNINDIHKVANQFISDLNYNFGDSGTYQIWLAKINGFNL